MDVRSNSGDICLWIPPKRLEGPLNVKARDVVFSDALSKDMNTFIEKSGKRREYFIGNFTAWSEGAGDVIKLKAKAGTVYVQYTGREPAAQGALGGVQPSVDWQKSFRGLRRPRSGGIIISMVKPLQALMARPRHKLATFSYAIRNFP